MRGPCRLLFVTFALACGSIPEPIPSSGTASARQAGTLDEIPPGLRVYERTRTYEVTGSKPRHVVDQMNTLGPINWAGTHWSGSTEWQVSWTFFTNPVEEGCTLRTVRATLDVTFLYPRWSDVPPRYVKRWNRFLAALEVHEEGHKQAGLRAARDVLTHLSAMPMAETCEAIQTRANANANYILEQAIKRDRLYDKQTRHGVTQGVRLR